MTRMNRLSSAARAALVLSCLARISGPAFAADPESPILSRALVELPAFEELPQARFGAISAAAYAKVRAVAAGKLERIVYSSQGHRVSAWVLPPAAPASSRLPVVVYCRGGVGPGSAISLTSPFHLYEMSRYAEAGFFVIAPQYRGADGGEGRDEVGGAEVHDILALERVLAFLQSADANQVFMVGSSRGAMNALAAVRAGFPSLGVVANGLPADWERAFARNPRLRQVAVDHWPDFANDATAAITRRSPARWAGDIEVPLLIQHGGADTTVHPTVALEFSRVLSEAGKPFDLVMYAGDDHAMTAHFDQLRGVLRPPQPRRRATRRQGNVRGAHGHRGIGPWSATTGSCRDRVVRSGDIRDSSVSWR